MEQNKAVKKETQPSKKNFLSEARRKIISDECFLLHLQGQTTKQIIEYVKEAHKHNLDYRTLEGWVKKRLASSKQTLDSEREIRTASELEKINNLEREYWNAWKESKKPIRTVKRKLVPLAEGEVAPRKKKGAEKIPDGFKIGDEIRETREQKGDVKFLLGVQWCVEQRTLLLGHSGASKVETIRDKDKEKEKPIVPGQRIVKFISNGIPQEQPTPPEA